MPEFKPPIRDMHFVLHEVFYGPGLWAKLPSLADSIDAASCDAILDEAAKITAQMIAPLNRSGDEEGAQWRNGQVITPSGFKEAYTAYSAGGWVGLGGNIEFGGMGMPKMLSVQCEEMLYGANSSFALYSALSSGACLAIDAYASEAMKRLYLPAMYEGRWAGTMCITEGNAGSDLGLMRTQARPEVDGSYRLFGSKIFITGGDQDLTENIVHLVLAKLPDAPPGARGISLFVVPKVLINANGSLGEPNAVNCGAIEHKMGIKASATCTINFDGAKGWLLGEANKGLAAMFTMMNYERLSIGIQGIANAEASYQCAVAYALDRLQGRDAQGTSSKDQTADPIIVHPDVRRMLLTMKAMTEGGRAFASYVARQLDIAKYGDNAQESADAQKLVALLTPVAKAFFTDTGLESCILGQQVLGGHGYIREWGQEQLVRDVRIAQIYEGTNGIQALDLLARKVVPDKGEALRQFTGLIRTFSETTGTVYSAELLNAVRLLENVSEWLVQQASINPNEVGAASVEYLQMVGYVAYAWLWARMAQVAEKKLESDPLFYGAKIATATFYFKRLLPRIAALELCIRAGSEALYGLDAEQF